MTIEEIKAMTKDFKEQYNNIRDQSKNAENILIELQKLNETKEIKSVTAERKLGKRGNGNSV